MATIATLVSQLVPDPWRVGHDFSPDLVVAHEALFREPQPRRSREPVATLAEWVRSVQPCRFGRVAAATGLLTVEVLGPDALRGPDRMLRRRVTAARARWAADSLEGRSAGLLLVLAAPQIATARPDAALLALACEFVSAFAGRTVQTDTVVLQDVLLRRDGASAWRWAVPANLFLTAADGRWYQDRRVPGGLAISVNSMGQFAAIATRSPELPAPNGTLSPVIRRLATRTVDGAGPALCRCRYPKHHPPGATATDPGKRSDRQFHAAYNLDWAIPSEFFCKVSHPREWRMHRFTEASVARDDAELRCSTGEWGELDGRTMEIAEVVSMNGPKWIKE